MLLFVMACTSCTINLIQTDTHGIAEDIGDPTSKTEVEADPNLTIPVKPL